MDARCAEKMVQTIAETDTAVKFTSHALGRMEERDISLADVMRVLRKGFVDEPPRPGRKKGEWSVKIVRHHRGCRDIGVVTVIVQESILKIITVEWEDL